MPLVDLSTFWIISIDIAAWAVLHLGISHVLFRMPRSRFENDTALTRIRPWEQQGETWQRLFNVKRWKDRLPDGDTLIGKGFPKKRLGGASAEYVQRFISESRRAEWTHWLLIPPAFLFFLWNPPWAGWIMVIYSLAANLPFILIQRYNRPRLVRLLHNIRAASGNLP